MKRINDEWFERYDAITGHYTKLEESILQDGFRNPLIITCGTPLNRTFNFLPQELRNKNDLLILEGYDGGSRLWVAQKRNIPIPCIINDTSGRYSNCPEIKTKQQLLKYYKDPPQYITLSSRGVVATRLKHSHLDNEFADPEQQAKKIIPLWFDLMTKYGYRPTVRPQHLKYLSKDQASRRNKYAKKDADINKRYTDLVARREEREKNLQEAGAMNKSKFLSKYQKVEITESQNDDVGDIVDVFKRDSMSQVKNKTIVQFGNDSGEILIRLHRTNRKFLNSKYYLIAGTPFDDLREHDAKREYYDKIQETRKNCVDNNLKSITIIDAKKEDMVGRFKTTAPDVIIFPEGKTNKELNYYLRTIKPVLLGTTRIVIQGEWDDKFVLDDRYFLTLEKLEKATIIEPVMGEDIKINPIRPLKEPAKRKARARKKVVPKRRVKKVVPADVVEGLDESTIPKKLDEIDGSQWDGVAYVVGGGSSLEGFDWNKLGPDKFVVAINQAHKVLPHAQIVYFTDIQYWRPMKASLLKHKGILVRGVLNPNAEEKHPRVTLMHLTGAQGYDTRPGKLRHGSNSTYAVVNMLAAHHNFKKIYLLGIDMSWGTKGDKSTTHWHAGYKRVTPQSTYHRMITNFKTLANKLKSHKIEVVNVINPKKPSSLHCFKKQTLEEVFGE